MFYVGAGQFLARASGGRYNPGQLLKDSNMASQKPIRPKARLPRGFRDRGAAEIMAAWQIADRPPPAKPVMEQPQYNLLHRERVEREYARLYDDIGLGTTIWSPLASGLLTGKYRDGVPADSRGSLAGYEWLQDRLTKGDELAKVERLRPIAEELGCTLAQLALAWCTLNPRVSTVITGASRPSQVLENFEALDVVPMLTADVLARIDAAVA